MVAPEYVHQNLLCDQKLSQKLLYLYPFHFCQQHLFLNSWAANIFIMFKIENKQTKNLTLSSNKEESEQTRKDNLKDPSLIRFLPLLPPNFQLYNSPETFIFSSLQLCYLIMSQTIAASLELMKISRVLLIVKISWIFQNPFKSQNETV